MVEVIETETVREEAETVVETEAGTEIAKEADPGTGNAVVGAETGTGEIEEVDTDLEIGRIAGPQDAAGPGIAEDHHEELNPGTDLGRGE